MAEWLRAGYIPTIPLHRIPRRFAQHNPWKGFRNFLLSRRWAGHVGRPIYGLSVPEDILVEMAVWGLAYKSSRAVGPTGTAWALWRWLDDLQTVSAPREAFTRSVEGLIVAWKQLTRRLMETLRQNPFSVLNAVVQEYNAAAGCDPYGECGALPYTATDARIDAVALIYTLVDSFPHVDTETRGEITKFIWLDLIPEAKGLAAKKLIAFVYRLW